MIDSAMISGLGFGIFLAIYLIYKVVKRGTEKGVICPFFILDIFMAFFLIGLEIDVFQTPMVMYEWGYTNKLLETFLLIGAGFLAIRANTYKDCYHIIDFKIPGGKHGRKNSED